MFSQGVFILEKEKMILEAFEMYKKCIANFKRTASRLGYVCSPYPSEENYISINASAVDTESAYQFFNMISQYLRDKNLGCDERDSGLNNIVTEMKADFDNITKGGKILYQYYGTYHFHTFIAVGIACYFFVSDNTKMFVELNRDKWESRGDYCSSNKIVFEVSPEFKGGKVYTKKHKSYSYM